MQLYSVGIQAATPAGTSARRFNNAPPASPVIPRNASLQSRDRRPSAGSYTSLQSPGGSAAALPPHTIPTSDRTHPFVALPGSSTSPRYPPTSVIEVTPADPMHFRGQPSRAPTHQQQSSPSWNQFPDPFMELSPQPSNFNATNATLPGSNNLSYP